MTLLDYFTLMRDVLTAISATKKAIASGEPAEELAMLAIRLKEACEVLSKAKCKDASSSDMRQVRRLIGEGERVVVGVAIVPSGNKIEKAAVEASQARS